LKSSVSIILPKGGNLFSAGAVADLKQCMDDAALLHSVAITSSNLCVLDSYQMSMAIKAAYPHVICYEQLLPFFEIPSVEEPAGYLDSKSS
jgi:hypothetical protein